MNYPFPANPDGAGMWLVEDADLVIQSTESFRAAGGTRTTWSNNYVYLGGDGGEESYFLDVGHTPAPVLVYDYESGAVMPLVPISQAGSLTCAASSKVSPRTSAR